MTLSPTKASTLASLIIYVYDYVLTFESELSLVWKHDRGTNMKKFLDIIYLVARYIPLPMLIFTLILEPGPHSHGSLIEVWRVMMFVGTAASELILFVRTCAIWDGHKRALLIFYVALIVIEGVVILATLRCQTSTPLDAIPLACIILNESTVICLTLHRYQRTFNGESALARVLLRDCLFFYICILATSLLNLIPIAFSWKHQSGLPEIQLALHSVLSTKVVRILREKRLHPDSHEIELHHYRGSSCNL